MKKTLVSALTTALVVGAASTTFAAANPFSDVPADHWAYDAVTQLAADGVVTGYGDGKFNGDKNITRYEMAQIVAKAMAKPNVSGNDKALVDKLAAEFADELNNLGVRVSNLERNADMVKWNGVAEYTFERDSVEHGGYKNGDAQTNSVLFRLEPTAEINSNWHVKARLDANSDLAADKGDTGNVVLKRVWAQGDYSNFQVKLGKFAPIDSDSIFDTTFSGAEASFGKVAKLTLGAGRKGLTSEDAASNRITGYNSNTNTYSNDYLNGNKGKDAAASYQYAGLDVNHGKLDAGVSYHHLNSDVFRDVQGQNGVHPYKNHGTSDEANIWMLKAGYTFSKNVALNGFYADNHDADSYNNAYSAQLTYKGAQAENKGTWGAWMAYRYLGQYVDMFSTFDAIKPGEKGWELGMNYTPYKNVVTVLRYGKGKTLEDQSRDASVVFGRVDFFF